MLKILIGHTIHGFLKSSAQRVHNATGRIIIFYVLNTQGNYTVDYTNNCIDKMSFATVFAILFNGCTGITG